MKCFSGAYQCALKGAFSVTFGHTNAQDGGCSVDMHFNNEFHHSDIEEKMKHAATVRTQRGRLELCNDGTVILHRCQSKQCQKTTEGVALTNALAKLGKVPLAGVVGHLQSTSWTPCSECVRRHCQCSGRKNKGRMRGVNDQVWVPADLVFRALTAPAGSRRLLRYESRRIWWQDKIDHAVSTGFFMVDFPATLHGQNESSEAFEPRHQTRRLRLPVMLRQKHEILRNIGHHVNQNLFNILQGTTIEECNGKINEAMHVAVEVARKKCVQESESETSSVQAAKIVRDRARQDLYTACLIWRQNPTEANRKHRNSISRIVRISEGKLERARLRMMGERMEKCATAAPIQMWSEMSKHSCDPGAPPPPVFKIFQHQNDSRGRRISSSKLDNTRNITQFGIKVASIPSNRSAACEESINESLIILSATNQSIVKNFPGFSPESAVCQSAMNPLAPCEKSDARRNILRDLSQTLQRHRDHRQQEKGGTIRGDRVQHKFPQECADLQKDIVSDEVQLILSKMSDCGAGSDGCPPIAFKLLENHSIVEITRLFNLIWHQGVLPESWMEHRSLLHYKGKNTDPHCLDNYRQLGIDQAMLKIFSLVMLERLELFISRTRGLSVSQGGFQRQRGTPEQALTLSETVRAAGQRVPVYLAFIDIERAYDTVSFPILWKKCIDRGIDGRFLAALQAIYHGSAKVMDMMGELSDKIPIELGVIQGNPLSPPLFNIYIDDALRKLEVERPDGLKLGLPLPIVAERGTSNPLRSVQARTQEDFIPTLFFADDGVLAETRLTVLQLMLDTLVVEFSLIGLLFNVGKTKWMVIPPMESPRQGNISIMDSDVYAKLKQEAMKTCLMVGGQPIKLVDEFEYLGIWMTWKWNWEKAWKSSIQRAQRELHQIRKGGLQHSGASLHAQLEYVRGKVASHFNYISAVTGAGGFKSSAPWRGCEDVLTDALRTVADCPIMNGDILKVESGTWDQKTRIYMLLLRFFSKILTCPMYSTVYRAMCLSFQSVTQRQLDAPLIADAEINRVHRQPWAQHVIAAATQFQLTPPRPDRLWMDLLGVDAYEANSHTYRTCANPDVFSVMDRVNLIPTSNILVAHQFRLRLIDTEKVGPKGESVFLEGKTCWTLPIGTRLENIFHSWSTELKEATFTVLRKKANRYRQSLVAEFLQTMGSRSGSRRWTRLVSGSFEQPYWRMTDVNSARRMLKARMDMMDVEDVRRRRPSTRSVPGSMSLSRLERVDRACYLCGCIDGIADIYWPETLEHVLLACPTYLKEREEVRSRLTAIFNSRGAAAAAEQVGLVGPPPSFIETGNGVGNTNLFMAVMLGTGVGPVLQPLLRPLITHNHGTRHAVAIEQHQRRPDVVARAKRASAEVFDVKTAKEAAKWVAALSFNWVGLLREYNTNPIASQSPGHDLVYGMAAFVEKLFARRRRLLRDNIDFVTRSRDPSGHTGVDEIFHSPVTRNTPNVDVIDVCSSRSVNLFCDDM